MDGARLSRFPHLSWLCQAFTSAPTPSTYAWHLRGTVHALHFVLRGAAPVRWISRGREVGYPLRPGSFHYLPADDEHHTIVSSMPEQVRSFTLFIPRHHLDDIAAADRVDGRMEFHRLLVHDDPVLRACMNSLAPPAPDADSRDDGRFDAAARRLVLRLVELSGGGVPDWHDDASGFERRTISMLVAHIDDHLRVSPGLADLAPLVGLSPSHFARKFRLSTGLSLHRFVNRRRLARSLDLLKAGTASLSSVALDLGFSSQSHFTRLFSDLVGMTPARYRRQFRPIVG